MLTTDYYLYHLLQGRPSLQFFHELYCQHLQQESPHALSYEQYLSDFNYEIHFLCWGSSGISFKITTPDHRSYAIKFTPYCTDCREGSVLKLLNEKILFQNLSPHIALYIASFQWEQFPRLLKKKNQSIKSFMQEKKLNDFDWVKTNVIISEFAYFSDLKRYVSEYILEQSEIAIIFFQLIYTLVHVRTIFPRFQHADINFTNIILQKDSHYDRDRFYIYQYNELFYRIPI